MPFDLRRTLEGQRDWLISLRDRIDKNKLWIGNTGNKATDAKAYRDEVCHALEQIETAITETRNA